MAPGPGDVVDHVPRNEVEPTVAVARQRVLTRLPSQLRGCGFGDARRGEHGAQDLDGRIRHVHRLHADLSGSEDDLPRVLEDHHVRVGEDTHAGPEVGQGESAGDLVAVWGAGVERLDVGHRDAACPQMVADVRCVPADQADDQVLGVDPGDAGERGEPPEHLEVETGVGIHHAGDGPPARRRADDEALRRGADGRARRAGWAAGTGVTRSVIVEASRGCVTRLPPGGRAQPQSGYRQDVAPTAAVDAAPRRLRARERSTSASRRGGARSRH